MDRYEQLVGKYIRYNKKRTLSTIVGVAFGAFLIFAVFNITFCLIKKGRDNAERIYNYDVVFYGLEEGQADIIKKHVGVENAYDGGFQNDVMKYGGIMFLDSFEETPFQFKMLRGSVPSNENEVMVNATTGDTCNVGETYEIKEMAGIFGLEQSMEFTVSGIFVYDGDYSQISEYEYSLIPAVGMMSSTQLEQVKKTDAVFVKVENPYGLLRFAKKTAKQLGCSYAINDAIACYYYQGSDGSVQNLYAAMILFLVTAICFMSVAVIKNTLRLSVAERMKDYGVLRCAGASMKQLKKMITMEAVCIGLISSVTGIVSSYVVLLIFSLCSDTYQFKHFYLLAAILDIIIIIVSMMIASVDPCKMIGRLTPVEAVRNQVKSSGKEKYKVRKARLATAVFGVEGGYACKNIMRNPKQFVTKVIALSLGLIIFIVVSTVSDSYRNLLNRYNGFDRYYNVAFDMSDDSFYIQNDTQGLYSSSNDAEAYMKYYDMRVQRALEGLSQKETVKNSLGCFISSRAIFTDGAKHQTFSFNLSEEYKEAVRRDQGTLAYDIEYPGDEAIRNGEGGGYPIYATGFLQPTLIGLEDARMNEMTKNLEAGTCNVDELGDDGIVLYNYGNVYVYNPDTGEEESKKIKKYNYKVGDTIDFIVSDEETYNQIYNEIYEEYKKRYEESEESKDRDEDYFEAKYRYYINFRTYEELYAKGMIKTYTIKGIVNDVMAVKSDYILDGAFILPYEKAEKLYYPDARNIYAFHSEVYDKDIMNILKQYEIGIEYQDISAELKTMDNIKKTIIIVIVVILLFMVINIFNNTSASLIFRKEEFALLRCVGMSKKKLLYMIMLEGMLAVILSIVISIILGALFSAGILWYIGFLFGEMTVKINIISIVLVITGITLLMFVTNMLPLMSYENNLAADLAEAE